MCNFSATLVKKCTKKGNHFRSSYKTWDEFWDDFSHTQNKAFVEKIDEADKCFIEFSLHFSRIYSALEEEGSKENYEEDGEYLSAQWKKAKQHLDQILMLKG